MPRAAGVLAALLVACTQPASRPLPPLDPERPAAIETPAEEPLAIEVVHADRGFSPDDSYISGMSLAVQEVNERGGAAGRQLALNVLSGHIELGAHDVMDALAKDPLAVFVVGNHSIVTEARPEIEDAGVPVVVFGADLYSRQALFRQAFQTSIPLGWQARVLASYLLEDRGVDEVLVVAQPSGMVVAREVFAEAFAEEGGPVPDVMGIPPASPLVRRERQRLEVAEAVIFTGLSATGIGLAGELARLESPPRLAIASDALAPSFEGMLSIGTVICLPYTWSGWADPIPRVHAFRERYSDADGAYPDAHEQDGYDAVMTLAEALERTGGQEGAALIHSLETIRDETYSSTPVRLSPDDHVLAEQSHLGLFAVAEEADPWGPEWAPWRPIMRTFTTDGEKVNLLDRDKRIFFPFWRPKAPSPKYWRSEYGIVTRPSDPLH